MPADNLEDLNPRNSDVSADLSSAAGNEAQTGGPRLPNPDLEVDGPSLHHVTTYIPREAIKEKGDDATVPDEPSIWKSDRRQKMVLLSLAVCNMTLFMSLAIMAPFYPKEANGRGISDSVSGFVFGTFALVQFLASPIFGKLIPVAGAKFLFSSGIFFAGSCSILFGCLQFFPANSDNKLLFIIFSFLIRIFLSLGCTAACTADFAICAHTFPKNSAMALGFLETFTGVGLMIGPALGGVLYDIGGFLLPFAVIGSILILSVPFYVCVLPSNYGTEGQHENVPIGKLLRDPVFLVTSMAVVMGAIMWVVLDPTLEPHLRQFNLSSTVLGFVFLLLSGSYAICSPLWGWLADKMSNSSPLLIVGFYCNSISMLFLGPSPLLGLQDYQRLWLNVVSLLVTGVSISLAVVPTFDRAITSAEKSGIEMNMGGHSAVAGLWMSFYALGDFIGPTAAGVLVDTVGFEWTMTYVSGSSAVAGTMVLISWIYETRCQKAAEDVRDSVSDADVVSERSPLLASHSNSVPYHSDAESVASASSRRSRYLPTVGRSRPLYRIRVRDKAPVTRTLSSPALHWQTRVLSSGYESV